MKHYCVAVLVAAQVPVVHGISGGIECPLPSHRGNASIYLLEGAVFNPIPKHLSLGFSKPHNAATSKRFGGTIRVNSPLRLPPADEHAFLPRLEAILEQRSRRRNPFADRSGGLMLFSLVAPALLLVMSAGALDILRGSALATLIERLVFLSLSVGVLGLCTRGDAIRMMS